MGKQWVGKMTNDAKKLAVLIDCENVSAKRVADIAEIVPRLGKPALRRLYADWSDPSNDEWMAASLQHGFDARQATVAVAGKNTIDIAMIIDAMDLMHSERFDGFVIVSSDSDFSVLAHRLRQNGTPCFGLGRKNASEALKSSYDEYFEFPPPVVELASVKHSTARAQASFHPPSKAVPQILKAMKPNQNGDGWVEVGKIEKKLKSKNKAFDPANYKCADLPELLKKTGQFEVAQRKGGMQARRKP